MSACWDLGLCGERLRTTFSNPSVRLILIRPEVIIQYWCLNKYSGST